jgi:hypothetical protein
MPRFYFHLSAPDEDFPDNIGSDVSDLADAHSRAVLLAKRVTDRERHGRKTTTSFHRDIPD